MLTISKTWVTSPARNIQSNQKQDSLKLKTLNRDTISFSGRKYVSDAVMTAVKKAEQENGKNFFKQFRELCERAENDDLAGKTDAYAQILKGESVKKALSLLDLVEKDSGTYPLLKETARDLKTRVGINSVT